MLPDPQGIDVDPNVDWSKVTSRLDGYSGDDITNICRFTGGRVAELQLQRTDPLHGGARP